MNGYRIESESFTILSLQWNRARSRVIHVTFSRVKISYVGKVERERTRGNRLSAINLAIGSRWRIVALPAPP